MRKVITTALLTSLLALAASACAAEAPVPFTPTPTPMPSAVRALLSVKHEAWRQAERSRYRFDLEWREPDGAESMATIEVNDGATTVLSGDLPPNAPTTINDLFAWLEDEVDSGRSRSTIDYSNKDYPRWGLLWPVGKTSDEGFKFVIRNILFGQFFELQAKLDEAKAKWESHALDDYIFDISIWNNFNFIGHPGPTRIVVEDGKISDRFEISRADHEPGIDSWNGTIDDLFAMVQRDINRPAYYLAVEFDEEYGYPVRIRVDGSVTTYDDELTYVTLSLFEGHDSIDAPPSVEIIFPLEDGSWERRIVTPEEIERWKSVIDAANTDPDTPICAVEPPDRPGDETLSISAFTGQCALRQDEMLTLTLIAPDEAPPGAYAHIEVDGPGTWENDGGRLQCFGDGVSICVGQFIDLPIDQWDSGRLTLTALPFFTGAEIFDVHWELRDGATGETIPGSQGHQLFYVDVLRR